jgi:hypothetical protein
VFKLKCLLELVEKRELMKLQEISLNLPDSDYKNTNLNSISDKIKSCKRDYLNLVLKKKALRNCSSRFRKFSQKALEKFVFSVLRIRYNTLIIIIIIYYDKFVLITIIIIRLSTYALHHYNNNNDSFLEKNSKQ